MKTIQYTIQDPLGIHARPAGLMVKVAKEYPDTQVSVTKDENTVKATQLLKLMGLAVKCGDTIVVSAEGPCETDAILAMDQFLKENL